MTHEEMLDQILISGVDIVGKDLRNILVTQRNHKMVFFVDFIAKSFKGLSFSDLQMQRQM